MKLKEKIKREMYNIKKFIHFVLSSPQTQAKITEPTIELRDVLGLPLGSIFDFEVHGDLLFNQNLRHRAYKVFYNPKLNLIISLAMANDFVIINFYAGLKIKSKLKYSQAYQIYNEFVRNLDVMNDQPPIIQTDKGFYSLFKVASEEFRRYNNQADYLRTFQNLSEDSALQFQNFTATFSNDFELQQLTKEDFINFIMPRPNQDKGRIFNLDPKENLVDEVKSLLSPMGFDPSHYLNINTNFILGKSRINANPLTMGVYVNPVEKARSRKTYELKIISILKFQVVANEDALRVSKKYGFGVPTIENTSNLARPKVTSIDKEYLTQILTNIKKFIEDKTRNIASVEIFREQKINDLTKFKFQFYVVIRDLKNCRDGKFYIIDYIRAINNIIKIIDLSKSRFIAKGELNPTEFKDNIEEDLYEDALLKIKKFEYYAGSFSIPKMEVEDE